MRNLQFSLVTMFAVTAVVGIGCAALVHGSYLWAMIVFNATLIILAGAILLAMRARDRARKFWIGFALFGWLYLFVTSPRQLTNGYDSYSDYHITTVLLNWLQRTLPEIESESNTVNSDPFIDDDPFGDVDETFTQSVLPAGDNSPAERADRDNESFSRHDDVDTVISTTTDLAASDDLDSTLEDENDPFSEIESPPPIEWDDVSGTGIIEGFFSISDFFESNWPFYVIGHSLWTLIIALVGGVLARAVWASESE